MLLRGQPTHRQAAPEPSLRASTLLSASAASLFCLFACVRVVAIGSVAFVAVAAMDSDSSDGEGLLDSLLTKNLKPDGFVVPPSWNQAELNASVLVSSSECSECEAQELHGFNVEQVEPIAAVASEADNIIARRAQASAVNLKAHKRGKHLRTADSKKRLDIHRQAGEHLTLISKTSTALGNPCGSKCINSGNCSRPFKLGDIVACHEYSYGTTTFNEQTQQWKTTASIREASQRWRDTQQSFVSYDPNSNLHKFSYCVAGRPTCEDYTRVAYGIPIGTWNKNRSLLREPGAMRVHAEMSSWDRASAQALQREKSSSTAEAVQWWLMMFPLWDAIPSEFIVKHPRLVWDRLYVRVPPWPSGLDPRIRYFNSYDLHFTIPEMLICSLLINDMFVFSCLFVSS